MRLFGKSHLVVISWSFLSNAVAMPVHLKEYTIVFKWL